jgi:hypothetical protein
MRPGGVLFDPAGRVLGRFEVSGQFILFPEPAEAEYGVFVGGADLGEPRVRWTAFVVRGDGSVAVLDHSAGATREAMA